VEIWETRRGGGNSKRQKRTAREGGIRLNAKPSSILLWDTMSERVVRKVGGVGENTIRTAWVKTYFSFASSDEANPEGIGRKKAGKIALQCNIDQKGK